MDGGSAHAASRVCLPLLFVTVSIFIQIPEAVETNLMEDRKEKVVPWLSVPQFGDWDQKREVPDYSVDFSKIRENRKQHKRDLSRASIGNEEELVAPSATSTTNTPHSQVDENQRLNHSNSNSPTTKKRILRYFNCCLKA